MSKLDESIMPFYVREIPGLDRPRQAWQWMRQTRQIPTASEWVRQEVADSWQRCLEDYGSNFYPSPFGQNLRNNRPVSTKTESLSALFEFFFQLDEQIQNSIAETGLTICLANADCRLVAIQGQDLGDCPLGRAICYIDADWSESQIGNNGIGSALITGEPVAFAGEEHYFDLLHPFTTAGYPVFDTDKRLLAVLGLISGQPIPPAMLKSLVCMVGRKAEEVVANQSQAQAATAAFPLQILNPAGLGNGLAAAKAPMREPEPSNASDLANRFVERSVRLQERRIPILVVGESGAGKEYLVRKAYEAGPRRGGPFIALNCASIPRELIESELFGYAAGSFTGARKEGKAGKFLLADKGVLLLDEIGDMGLDLQAVLLRVLENSEFYPVGASEPVRVNVQIFAATNVPIQQAVKEGRFRRDLYYRLNGAQFILPPLRDREDKLTLIQQLLQKELELSGRLEPVQLEDAVLDLFMRHPWPGNVRQLSNVIRSSLHMTEGNTVCLTDLPDDFLEELQELEQVAREANLAPATSEPAPIEVRPEIDAVSLADWELLGIKQALKTCKGNLTQTAKALGITRGTLYKKLSEYGLSPR